MKNEDIILACVVLGVSYMLYKANTEQTISKNVVRNTIDVMSEVITFPAKITIPEPTMINIINNIGKIIQTQSSGGGGAR
jgi:hypothetical protein